MIRRDVLKSLGVAAASSGASGLTLTQAEAQEAEQMALSFGAYATPWDPADPDIPGRQNIVVSRQPGLDIDGADVVASASAAVFNWTLPTDGGNVAGCAFTPPRRVASATSRSASTAFSRSCASSRASP